MVMRYAKQPFTVTTSKGQTYTIPAVSDASNHSHHSHHSGMYAALISKQCTLCGTERYHQLTWPTQLSTMRNPPVM